MSGSAISYRVTPRKARELCLDVLQANLIPFLRSSPGVGKSSIMRGIARDTNVELIDHRLSTSEPTDLSGLPGFVNGKARFQPFDELFPLRDTPLPNGKDGWMLFFDEANSALKQTLAACYKLLLDRMTGQHPLHDNVVIALAGNLDTDRAIVNPIGTAMQSRVIHFELEVNFREWHEDVALKEDYDSRIIAFLSMYESKLMDFKADHTDKTFCCPRTWEFMNRLVKGREVTNDKTPLYAGTITSGVAVEFVQFCQVITNLVRVPEILADPDNCRLPASPELKWATITSMLEKVTEANYAKLAAYADRFDMAFRVLFLRSIIAKFPELLRHPATVKNRIELNRYLTS